MTTNVIDEGAPDLCPQCGRPFTAQWPAMAPDGSVKTLGVVTFAHDDSGAPPPRCSVAANRVPWLYERPPRLSRVADAPAQDE